MQLRLSRKEWAVLHAMPLLDGSEDAARFIDDEEREEGEERPWEAPPAAGAAGTATHAAAPAPTPINADELRALGAQAEELEGLLLHELNGHTQLSRSVKEVPR